MNNKTFSRRDFMKTIAVGAAALALPQSLKAKNAPGNRPNIVLMLVDDMGYSDLGCYGGEIDTPNIDALARNGLRFSQFYCTAKCAPTRVCLMSGLYNYQAGNRKMENSATIAEVLQKAGYFTFITGKWHINTDEPTDWGFQRFFGHLSGATNYWKGNETYRLNGQPFNDFGEDFYSTDANTDYAIRFIDESIKSKKPFFAYIAHNAPHSYLHAYEKDVMKYRGRYSIGWDKLREQRYKRQIELGLIKPKWKLSPRPEEIPAWDSLAKEQKDWEDFRMAAYSATVDRIDQNVGRLVKHLKQKKIFDNTLFLILSDNGASPFEKGTKGKGHKPWEYKPWDHRSCWMQGLGWANASNTPFQRYKQNQHEGGISTPLVVHWPDGLKTKPGQITHQSGHLIDISATLYELASATYPSTCNGRKITALQGKSLVPVFKGKQRKGHDWIYFQYAKNRAIIKGKWKLVSARSGPWELYDMECDRTELNNLANKMPELTSELKQLWHYVAKNVDHLPDKWDGPVKDSIRPWGINDAGNVNYREQLKPYPIKNL